MAENQRAPRHAEIDVDVAVDIDQAASGRFTDEARDAANATKGAYRRMHRHPE